tara:strand:- start:227 stop:1366 length:1140 start_codon:yes stop_codon:yes gene_type:complete
MDTTDKSIRFNKNGICNHCEKYEKKFLHIKENKKYLENKFQEEIQRVKKEGKNRKYDCLIGLSGGLDSSFLTYLAWKNNLRTMIIHFDNGWDSELAVNNIENIINTTGFDYYNYIVDWEEFKDLQLSYLKASVLDVEVPTDLAIYGLIPKMALKYGVKNIFSGNNPVTETTMPSSWIFENKSDYSNLFGIHKRYGSVSLKTFPYYSYLDQFFFVTINKIKTVKPLPDLNFSYSDMKKILRDEFNWRDYDMKHGESIFTKFYQSYILPKKFNIDKRRAHLSDMINAKQISRDEAINFLNDNPPSSLLSENEIDYVIRKLGLSKNDFNKIMSLPIRSHYDFPIAKKHGNVIIYFILITIYNVYKIIKPFRDKMRFKPPHNV